MIEDLISMTESRRSSHSVVIEDLRQQIHNIVPPLADPRNGFTLLDFPNYSNVGDSLIWLGELKFFSDYFNRLPSYVSTLDGFDPHKMAGSVPTGPIYLSGGGNFGDIWPRFQVFRERLLADFPGRRIVQLPQTVKFGSRENLLRTREVIKQHSNFALLVRDRASLDVAVNELDCEVHLCPDMAFCLGSLETPVRPIYDAIYLLRTDKERLIGDIHPTHLAGTRSIVCDWLQEDRPTQIMRSFMLLTRVQLQRLLGATDPVGRVYREFSRAQVQRGITLLAGAKTVVTDRLHGHILSVLLGIPHAVVDNSYGKLSSFVKAWTRKAKNVYLAASLEEAKAWADARA
jgi:exopolysaccharide biosynthesis predicted pyruvyltransferase EpsI